MKWNDRDLSFLKEHYFCSDKNLLISQLNRNWCAIKKKANKMNLKRTRSNGNVKFFDTWTSDMSYVLGFIAADGCITENPFELSIELSEKDIEHVKRIRDLLAPENSIFVKNKQVNNKQHRSVGFSTASDYMCKRLIQLGITPRKSLTLEFPEIPYKYLNNFILGYFDGDGSIFYNKRGSWAINFVGTELFLRSINDIFNKELNISKKIYSRGNIFRLTYHLYDSIKIGKWMYKESNLYLYRKAYLFNRLEKNGRIRAT